MFAIKYFSRLSDQTKFHLSMWTFAVIVMISVMLILSVLSVKRFYNFENEITELVKTSAIAASREIEATINELQRDVAVFTAENAELLANIYEYKDTQPAQRQKLASMIEKRVPNMFTYAITNEDGTEVLDDFNFDVGDICRIDVQDFVLNAYKQNIRIHPHPDKYHFDIMAPFVGFNNKILVFFISFLPNEITRILKNYSNPNYELIITNSVYSNLIEVSKGGTRQTLAEPYYITHHNINYKGPINNSSWELVAVLTDNLFSSYIENIITDAVIMLLIFLLVCSPMFVIIQRQARKRHEAIAALKNSENHFYDLYEYAPDIYMTIAGNGEILSANKHAREYFFNAYHARRSDNFFHYIHADDVKRVAKQVKNIFDRQILESEIDFRCNKQFNRSQYMQAKLRLTPVIQNQDRNLRIVCRDVTKSIIKSRNKLARLAEQRDTLVREVHHRIKNNLHNVISLLKTYARKDSSLAPSIQDASLKIASIAEVYGLQSSAALNGVLVSELVTAIIENEKKLFSSKINLAVDGAVKHDGRLISQEATPIAVIISELITNAIKHNFKSAETAIVYVTIARVAGSIKIQVRNKMRMRLNDSFHFDSFSTGQGIKLMRSLLPPRGAQLQHHKTNGDMIAALALAAPEVICFEKDTHAIFASC